MGWKRGQFARPAPSTEPRSPNRRPALAVTAAVLLALAATAKLTTVPGTLLAAIGIPFLLWSTVFWGLRRSRPTRHALLLHLMLPWLAGTAALLGAVYHVDRARWLWYRVTGYNITHAEDVAVPSLAALVERFPFFSVLDGDPPRLVLRKGTHAITSTIAVPPGTTLVIEPGTVLRFGSGRSLVSYSPVLARGTAKEPITFTARHAWLKWGGLGIVHSAQSVFEHAVFEHGRHARVNDIDLLGNLTVIASDVRITNSRFSSLFGRDAVHIRGGDVYISGNLFRDVFKDCLDLDGGRGTIRRNRFLNCGDEGIDLSMDYDLLVLDNVIRDRHGGRIAAERNLEELRSLNTLGYPEDPSACRGFWPFTRCAAGSSGRGRWK